ncbi:MAG: undecaprenyl/decaprenyl-phosphate alpha-N-acetylglucosaminyl 1-phosphate transferase [candidate division Zixibacteria bacterium]|nr:undecaprenyl/decaprenyl-phosphate alpha-N-acetylglucosaminyl 1-phosphate transferase [candidate division Zixibacteria bacterium]
MKLANLIIIIVGFYLTILLTPLVIRVCRRFNILDQPGGRKIHKQPIPRLGGIAMFIAFIVAEIIGFLFYPELLNIGNRELTGITLGLTVIFVGGLWDDFRELKPYQKLIIQALAAIVTIYFGYQVRLLTIPFQGTIVLGNWGIPVTFFWIVGLINAMNFLDGMDGLATGIGFIVAATFFASGLIFETLFPVVIACGLMGVTAGFLRYNYPPASIFMGDSGSMMIGYMFAVISIIWPKSLATITMTVPIMALGVPIFETLVTILRRIFTGKSIYVADSRHIFHMLTLSGLSPIVTLWVFYLASMLFSFVVIAIIAPDRGLLLGMVAVFILIVSFLFLKFAKKLF